MTGTARGIPPNPGLEKELKELMLKSLGGDKRAYETLLERIAGMLRSYLKKSVNPGRVSHEQVEDLVQDVLFAVHQKRGTYRTDLPLLPWLFTIARYRLIDSYRAEGRKPISVEFDDELDRELDTIQHGGPPATDQATNKADLEVLLGSLTEKQRRVIELAKVEELPLAEVSQRMNMSLSAVKVTIHRALTALRKNQKAGENEDN